MAVHRLGKILIALIICLSLQIPFSYAKPAQAQPLAAPVVQSQDSSCWGVDFVVLVDQSSSMWDTRGGLHANDPQGYRFEAVKDALTELVLHRQEDCPDVVHRLGMVTFGSYREIILNMVRIDLSIEDNADIWSKSYVTEIDAASLDHSQGGTDFRMAFNAARDIINQALPVEETSGNGARRSAVVLLTDGAPTTDSGAVIENDRPNYMCRLMRDMRDPFWDSQYIFMLALNADDSYLNEVGCEGRLVGDNLAEIAQNHRGKLYDLPYNEQAVPAFLNDVFAVMIDRPGRDIQCGQEFYVQPYLQEAQFKFYRRKGDNEPIILSKLDEVTGEEIYSITADQESPNNNPNRMGDMVFRSDRYRVSVVKAIYVFERPLAGTWKFQMQGVSTEECMKRVVARTIPLATDARIVLPDFKIYYPLYAEPPYHDTDPQAVVPYQMKLETVDGKPITQNQSYPLAVKATVMLPSGATSLPDGTSLVDIPMNEVETGVWATNNFPVVTPEEGENYRVTIRGTAPNADPNIGGEYEVFSVSTTYKSRKLDRYNFEVLSPQLDAQQTAYLMCNAVQDGRKVGVPIDVKVKLTSPDVSADALTNFITSDKNQAFKATLLDTARVPLAEVYLQPTSENAVFTGTLLEGQENLVGCGETLLRIEFLGGYDNSRSTLPRSIAEMKLRRMEGEGVVVQIEQPKPDAPPVLIHPDFSSACLGPDGVDPFRVAFRLFDLQNQPLDPALISSDPQNMYEVLVTGPEGANDILTLKVDATDRLLITAEGGQSLDLPGSYKIEIRPKLDKFVNGYVPADTTTPGVTVTRKDDTFTLPSTCIIIKWIAGILSVLLLVAILCAVTGGAGGVLEFTRSGNENDVVDSVKLSSMRIFSTVKKKALADMDIREIKTRKVKPFDPTASRAVAITVIAIDGSVMFSGQLDKDQPSPFTSTEDIVYR